MRRLARYLRRAGAALVTLIVAGGFVLWVSLPDVRRLREGWPERTAYMERRIEEARDAGAEIRIAYRPVPLSRIPRSLQRAVLVAEDAAFYGHRGFDWYELREAVRRAWERKAAPRGASTITQQLARNLYLSPERSYLRKVREALITRRLERALDKRRILELYLNVIELGDGVYGVEAAARRYFGVSVADVSEAEAARLAASIPAPRRDNPATGTRTFRWRTRLVAARAFGAPGDTMAPPAEPPDVAPDVFGLPPSDAEAGPGAGEYGAPEGAVAGEGGPDEPAAGEGAPPAEPAAGEGGDGEPAPRDGAEPDG